MKIFVFVFDSADSLFKLIEKRTRSEKKNYLLNTPYTRQLLKLFIPMCLDQVLYYVLVLFLRVVANMKNGSALEHKRFIYS